MHDTLAMLYEHDCGHNHAELAAGESLTQIIAQVKSAFEKAAVYVHGQKKYRPQMLKDPAIKAVIKSTNKALQQAISKSITAEVPQAMREALQKNVFYFSGMKTHAQMEELSSKLMNDQGKIKPLDNFTEDAKKLNETYNDNYLRAERNFATKSAQTAAKWSKYEQGKERYDLRYLTDNGPNVRDSHRALEFTTLPVDDPFWDKYTPPNGYNCHCFLVQVRKGEYPVSDSEEAQAKGEAATTQVNKDGVNKAEMFRFNPGKEMQVMPPDHPYTSGDCGKLAAVWHTLSAMQKVQLAGQADKCKAKKVVEEIAKEKVTIPQKREIYELPVDKQYVKSKEGVYIHRLAGIKDDHSDILMAAQELKSKTATPHLLPEIHQDEKEARKKLFPGYTRKTSNPDIWLKEPNEFWEVEKSLGTSKRNVRQRINSGLEQADNLYLILEDKKHMKYAEALLKKKSNKYIIK